MAAQTTGRKKARRVRNNDRVRVIAGEFKGKSGLVQKLDLESQRARVEIDGIDDDDKVKVHVKRSNEFPNGTIQYQNPTIHVSNLVKEELAKEPAAAAESAPATDDEK